METNYQHINLKETLSIVANKSSLSDEETRLIIDNLLQNYQIINSNDYLIVYILIDILCNQCSISYFDKLQLQEIQAFILVQILKSENPMMDSSESVECEAPANNEDYEQVKQFFLNKLKKVELTEKFPEYEFIRYHYRDNISFAPRTYLMEFKLDHEGNNLGYIKEPYLELSNDEYNSLYNGLIDKILSYQKVD